MSSLFQYENLVKLPETKSELPDVLPSSPRTAVILPNNDLNEDTKSFIFKIISAIKLNPENDILLCKLDNYETLQLAELVDTHKLDFVITFGIHADTLSLQNKFNPFHWHRYEQFVLLACPSIDEIQNDKNQKGNLWNALKNEYLS